MQQYARTIPPAAQAQLERLGYALIVESVRAIVRELLPLSVETAVT